MEGIYKQRKGRNWREPCGGKSDEERRDGKWAVKGKGRGGEVENGRTMKSRARKRAAHVRYTRGVIWPRKFKVSDPLHQSSYTTRVT